MELVNPSEISGKIMTLLENARERVLIVSPYNDISKWTRMRARLADCVARGVPTTLVYREGQEPAGLAGIPIAMYPVPMLHAKAYLSEREGVVASMNLLKASDDKSLDIGYHITELGRVRELWEYCEQHFSRRDAASTELLPSEIAAEPILSAFFHNPRHAEHSKIMSGTPAKHYFPGSAVIQDFGYEFGGQRVGPRLEFHPSGLVARSKYYEGGEVACDKVVVFDGTVSLYDVVFSLANMVGSLYRCSIEGVYFDELIAGYTARQPEPLYAHIEEVLGVSFDPQDHLTFGQLADDLKWRLKGNRGKRTWSLRPPIM